MTEPQAIKLVEDYLSNHKHKPSRIDHKKTQEGEKSPDFIVEHGKSIFYCEVKTPSLLPNKDTNMFHWTTTVSKIRALIHKAVKQFEAQDPNHKKPWVLFFISSHMQLNWTNYSHAIQGKIAFGNDLIRDLEKFVSDTDGDVIKIDLSIWCQVNPNTLRVHQLVPFLNTGSPLIDETQRIYESLIPYESEKINDANIRLYK